MLLGSVFCCNRFLIPPISVFFGLAGYAFGSIWILNFMFCLLEFFTFLLVGLNVNGNITIDNTGEYPCVLWGYSVFILLYIHHNLFMGTNMPNATAIQS